MLSHEERIAEVKRRIAEKEQQKRLRQARIAAVSGVAACLAVIVGVSLFMPGIVSWELPPALKQRQRCSAAAPRWDISSSDCLPLFSAYA